MVRGGSQGVGKIVDHDNTTKIRTKLDSCNLSGKGTDKTKPEAFASGLKGSMCDQGKCKASNRHLSF